MEDEPNIAELYKIAFEEEGFVVEAVESGREAMVQLEKFVKDDVDRPNAMIIDILLPDISGMEILREVRKHEIFDRTPVIMFTNYSSDKIKEEIQIIPNTKYLLKMEVTPAQLVGIVKEMLGV